MAKHWSSLWKSRAVGSLTSSSSLTGHSSFNQTSQVQYRFIRVRERSVERHPPVRADESTSHSFLVWNRGCVSIWVNTNLQRWFYMSAGFLTSLELWALLIQAPSQIVLSFIIHAYTCTSFRLHFLLWPPDLEGQDKHVHLKIIHL